MLRRVAPRVQEPWQLAGLGREAVRRVELPRQVVLRQEAPWRRRVASRRVVHLAPINSLHSRRSAALLQDLRPGVDWLQVGCVHIGCLRRAAGLQLPYWSRLFLLQDPNQNRRHMPLRDTQALYPLLRSTVHAVCGKRDVSRLVGYWKNRLLRLYSRHFRVELRSRNDMALPRKFRLLKQERDSRR